MTHMITAGWHWLTTDARPIDIAMLVIESAILLVMVIEIVFGSSERFEKRRRRKRVEKRLAGLSTDVATALKALVLKDTQLNEESSAELRRFPVPVVEPDFKSGWRVLPEDRAAVEKWAQKNDKS